MANHEATPTVIGLLSTGGDTDSPIPAPAAAVDIAPDMGPLMSSPGTGGDTDSPIPAPAAAVYIAPDMGPLMSSPGTGGDADSPIPAPAAAVDVTVDMETLMSSPGDSPSPLNNIGPTLGFEISLSEGPEQQTRTPGGGLGPNRTNWIRWSVPLDDFHFVSDATLGVTVNLANLFMNRSNNIWQLAFLAGANLFTNTLVAVNYLHGEAQEAHEINWRAELIASVGAPIAVSVFTLLSSFRFASDPERWSNWIAELSRVNAAMIGGGPLAFYWMSKLGTQN